MKDNKTLNEALVKKLNSLREDVIKANLQIPLNKMNRALKTAEEEGVSIFFKTVLKPLFTGIELGQYKKYIDQQTSMNLIDQMNREFIKECCQRLKDEWIKDVDLKYGPLNKDNAYDYYQLWIKENDIPVDDPASIIEELLASLVIKDLDISSSMSNYLEKIILTSPMINKLKDTWKSTNYLKKLFKDIYR